MENLEKKKLGTNKDKRKNVRKDNENLWGRKERQILKLIKERKKKE